MTTFFSNIVFKINSFLADSGTSSTTKNDYNNTVSPIYEFLDTFGPYLLGLLLGVCAIYGIVLGVSYAKAEESKDRDAVKKKMVGAGISLGIIIILVFVLYTMRDTFIDVMNE